MSADAKPNPLLQALSSMPDDEALPAILDFLDRAQVTVYGISLRPDDLLELKRFMALHNITPQEALK